MLTPKIASEYHKKCPKKRVEVNFFNLKTLYITVHDISTLILFFALNSLSIDCIDIFLKEGPYHLCDRSREVSASLKNVADVNISVLGGES